MPATTDTFATLTGITRGDGACDCCGRALGRIFAVRYPDGRQAFLGRVCAAKATGYAARQVQRLADQAARRALVADRQAVIAGAFPDANPDDALTAATSDDLWGRGTRAYADWRDYLTAMAARRR